MDCKSDDKYRLPCLFVNHGGGPMPILGQDETTRSNLKNIATRCIPTQLSGPPSINENAKPKAILVISAHWESSPIRVTSSQRPSLLFDYYGFPPESYKLTYPAQGNPALAERIRALLFTTGLECKLDDTRGLDHGVFIPLMCAFPAAEVPVVALSLDSSLDPATHLQIGAALEPLREEGVLILGSGMSFHNLPEFQMKGRRQSALVAGEEFDRALADAVTVPNVKQRNDALESWDTLTNARKAHPREEHLLPLLVCAGAAGEDFGRQVDDCGVMGAAVSAFSFP